MVYYNISEVLHIYIRGCLWVLKISPSIQQSYINAILDCLETRKHCKAIMYDLLLFTPTKKALMTKLEDLLKAL